MSTAPIRLGFDSYSIRAFHWKAIQLLDYAAGLKLDTIQLSGLEDYESFEPEYLARVKDHAAKVGIVIDGGMGCICPLSKSWNQKAGDPTENILRGLRVAKAVGAVSMRCYMGSAPDRRGKDPIEALMESTIAVFRSVRAEALDLGVRIVLENHAGDMQAWELAGLCEEAGKDYVGVTLDTGNATWTMEDPLENLEVLGPYTVTTSLRDSAVWESPHGATVQWTAMGEGDVDLKRYFKRFSELCPDVPVHIETISGFNREIPYLDADFWKAWPHAKAKDFARFVALAKRGKPREPYKAPKSADPKATEQAYQKAELERSIKYCKLLHLGLKG